MKLEPPRYPHPLPGSKGKSTLKLPPPSKIPCQSLTKSVKAHHENHPLLRRLQHLGLPPCQHHRSLPRPPPPRRPLDRCPRPRTRTRLPHHRRRPKWPHHRPRRSLQHRPERPRLSPRLSRKPQTHRHRRTHARLQRPKNRLLCSSWRNRRRRRGSRPPHSLPPLRPPQSTSQTPPRLPTTRRRHVASP